LIPVPAQLTRIVIASRGVAEISLVMRKFSGQGRRLMMGVEIIPVFPRAFSGLRLFCFLWPAARRASWNFDR
jgi:hypothetical protein